MQRFDFKAPSSISSGATTSVDLGLQILTALLMVFATTLILVEADAHFAPPGLDNLDSQLLISTFD